MLRLTTSVLALAAILSAAACGDAVPEARFVSEAVAAPAQSGPDYGWKTQAQPTEDGEVMSYQ